MMNVLHRFLLILLHLFHISIIVFCVIGWVIPQTRQWHLLLCTLIMASWFGLGAWKGWGYCLVTDVQWRLVNRFGGTAPPFGYMPMLWQRITGHEADAVLVDQVTQIIFYLSIIASVWANWGWLRSLM